MSDIDRPPYGGSSAVAIGCLVLGLIGVYFTFQQNWREVIILVIGGLAIGAVYLASLRATQAASNELSTPALTPHIQPARSERRIFIVEQLALQARRLAEHLGALNDVADATVEFTTSITHEAEETPEETQLIETVEEIRVLANEMLLKVRDLRNNTASMQQHVAQIISTVDGATP